jgi:cyclopropane fatty-acyl-phospholipid synthase-like methyltransferase
MKENSWYEDWFADEHYLALYKHRNSDEASAALDLIERSAPIAKDAAILDLACGAGRHSIGLAKRGYTNITAIDLSPTLLHEAEKKAKAEGVEIIFKKQDMRNFSGKYDLIINLFTSFGYFQSDEENEKVICEVGDHLHTNGFFAFDFLNAALTEKKLIACDEKILSSGERVEMYRMIHDHRVDKKIVIHADGAKKEFLESVRLFTLPDFERIFSKAGLMINETFGDYSGTPFDEGSSPRLFLVAQKV